eukprot:1350578-Pleurochrysis_carterae.AAC.3
MIASALSTCQVPQVQKSEHCVSWELLSRHRTFRCARHSKPEQRGADIPCLDVHSPGFAARRLRPRAASAMLLSPRTDCTIKPTSVHAQT